MKPIYIPDLLSLANQTKIIELNQTIPDLETLTPVTGEIKITHQGNYLEVSAQTKAIITLSCHRCLQQYNHSLNLDIKELIWLQDDLYHPLDNQEHELELADLVETLPPKGYFSPVTWIYEHLTLSIPYRQLCDPQCPGIPVTHSPLNSIDKRWSSLESLLNQPPN